MSKRLDLSPFMFNSEAFPIQPFSLLEPWLKAQTELLTTMKRVSDHWFERRAADAVSLQQAAENLGKCKGSDDFLEVQQQCVRVLAERIAADLSGFRDDMMSIGESAGSALGGGSSLTASPGSGARKQAAE